MAALVREQRNALLIGFSSAQGQTQVNPTRKGDARVWQATENLVVLTSEAKRQR